MEKVVGESQPQAHGTFLIHAEPSQLCLCRTALEANHIGKSLTGKMRYKVKATGSNQHIGSPSVPCRRHCCQQKKASRGSALVAGQRWRCIVIVGSPVLHCYTNSGHGKSRCPTGRFGIWCQQMGKGSVSFFHFSDRFSIVFP